MKKVRQKLHQITGGKLLCGAKRVHMALICLWSPKNVFYAQDGTSKPARADQSYTLKVKPKEKVDSENRWIHAYKIVLADRRKN